VEVIYTFFNSVNIQYIYLTFYTPESASELPVIGVYYTFNIIMNAISLFGSVIILRLHFKKHSKTPVPAWIKFILLIRINQIHYKELIPANKKKSKERFDTNNSKNQSYTYKLYKLHKSNLYKSKEEKMKLKKNEETSKEWKLVNTRIEYIFLFINVVTIMTATVMLFGKYFFFDPKINENQCGCEYSFI